MSAMTEFDRTIASWLETAGPSDVRPEVIDTAIDRARRIPQRGGIPALVVGPASWPPTRRRPYAFADLPPAVRIGIVLALTVATIAGAVVAGSRWLFPEPLRFYEGVFVPTSAPDLMAM